MIGFGQITLDLAGNNLTNFPYFDFATSFNSDEDIFITIDPFLNPSVVGQQIDVYVVEHQNTQDWITNPMLTDIRPGGMQNHMFSSNTIQGNSLLLISANNLSGMNGHMLGHGYDVIIDVNQNGTLDSSDLIDNENEKAGLYVVNDYSLPGPFDVITHYNNGGPFLEQNMYYPSDIVNLDLLPIIFIAHGWTYTNQDYDFIGNHLASFGYIVVAIDNNTLSGGSSGTQESSLDLIANIDYLFDNISAINNGLFVGHIDANNIGLIGHSTGGETVVRSYTRLETGTNTSNHISFEDINLMISLAPVTFLDGNQCNPSNCNYALLVGAADMDASGFASDNYWQTFSLYERGSGNKHAFYFHGAGHESFADLGTLVYSSGPDLIPIVEGNNLTKSYVLGLCEMYLKNNYATEEYISSSYSKLHPTSLSDNLIVSTESKLKNTLNTTVLEDFEMTSSAVNNVISTVNNYQTILMKDQDGSFDWTGSQWSNGMTRARYSDDPHCSVFDFNTDSYIEYEIAPSYSDWSESEFLSFRTAQLTRHPNTLDLDTNLDFSITLIDNNLNQSSIRILDINTVINRPYKRSAGGVLNLCLPDGDYQSISHPGFWQQDQEYEIPGYVSMQYGSGTTNFTITGGNPCTDVQILLYSPYCYGWDIGYLDIVDDLGDIVSSTSLSAGCSPDYGYGWQNEFQSVKINLNSFTHNNSNVDLTNISKLKFEFGPSYGSNKGALAIDDLEITAIQNLTSGIENMTAIIQKPDRELLKITDVLGRTINKATNTPLFYIYDDGTVEKKIILE